MVVGIVNKRMERYSGSFSVIITIININECQYGMGKDLFLL